jgi:FADH2 O2-dependent halogenase
VERLFDQSRDAMLAYRDGRLTRDQVIARIFGLLRESELCPDVWGTLDPEDRCPSGVFTLWPLMRILLWGKFRSPRHVRGSYFTGGGRMVAREAVEAYTTSVRHGGSVVRQTVRDSWVNWNRDWARRPAPRTVNPGGREGK